MSTNILITGAAGYIGGSLVADFLARGLTKRENIHAAVRTEEQAKALSKLGINVLQLDLSDEESVVQSLLSHKIHIVIQTASSLDAGLSLPLITALGKQREVSGEATYYIHTSGLSAFYEKTGWPHGETKDNARVFDVEKEVADSFPIRKTDVAVTEHAKAQGVTSFIVIPSTVYGKGSGEWNQLSVILPIFIQGCISHKGVHKFAENTKVSAVHISDLTDLYGLIVRRILEEKTPPSGPEGYYFALAHDFFWWELLDHLAAALEVDGLITDSRADLWASDDAAAAALGVPVQFVQILWNSGDNIISENPFRLGWNPVWTKDRFLRNIGDEIQSVVQLGKAKSSLVDSLFASAREA